MQVSRTPRGIGASACLEDEEGTGVTISGTILSQERQHDIEEAGRGHGIRKYNVGWEYSAVALVLAGQTWLSPPPVGFRGSKAFRDWKTVQVE